VVKVGGDVHREAVKRHVPFDRDADSDHLFVADPDARVAGATLAGDARGARL
jgi:hypothetical protein